jgi:hypothetical protein
MVSDRADLMWHDVPIGVITPWTTIFTLSREGVNLSALCPVCGAPSLHRWFQLHRPRRVKPSDAWLSRGSEWEWCSTCHSYLHTSGRVPSWWEAPFELNDDSLRHDPDPIEEARRHFDADRSP